MSAGRAAQRDAAKRCAVDRAFQKYMDVRLRLWSDADQAEWEKRVDRMTEKYRDATNNT